MKSSWIGSPVLKACRSISGTEAANILDFIAVERALLLGPRMPPWANAGGRSPMKPMAI
jgi:hypothetical protein